MKLVDSKKLRELQNNPVNIRNICIVAHVDHGKTTLADSLISSNGIISQKMSGKLRYMDSRVDEQERGITMKSSSIALFHLFNENEFLVNLIDSPGHIDFSSEVSTAVRLCDGALVVVDVVEGVCPQTRLALQQAYTENIKAVLVMNKIDRLIVEMQLTPLDAYVHMMQVLEQVNAVMGELFANQVLEDDVEQNESKATTEKSDDNNFYDWTSPLEEADDSNLYFAPEQNNVVFASAIDGWGFTVKDFAKIYASKLGAREDILQKVLWGDYYVNAKSKRFMKGAQEKAKKPVFVQLILDNVWSVYETVVLRNEKEKVPSICEKLGIKLTARDLRHTDTRIQLQSLMTQWLPLSTTVLNMVVTHLPSPKEILPEKVERLMCSKHRDLESYPEETRSLREHFLACDSSENRPVIVFISKMFSVDRNMLPENKPKPLTPEDMALRRERIKQIRLQAESSEVNREIIVDTPSENVAEEVQPIEELDKHAFVAFARVFSGRIRKGTKVYVLGPKHDPVKTVGKKDICVEDNLTLKDLGNDQHVTCTEIKSIYLLMGRELEELDEAIAGNIIGIGGLEEHVLKTATLSSSIACPSFSELRFTAVPILRVAVEPANPTQLPQLVKGLKLLNQADSCVQVLLQETGEHVLVTAGEVHLERCLEDLKNDYAKIEVSVSEPIVPFRETIVEPPKIDMVNEQIDKQNFTKPKKITIQTPNKQCTIILEAVPLPQQITKLLEEYTDLLKIISTHIKVKQSSIQRLERLNLNDVNIEKLSEKTLKTIQDFKVELNKIAPKEWANIFDEIWSAGPRNCGPNLLINKTQDYKTSFFNEIEDLNDVRREYENSFVNGFQLATLAGPLCEEPMMGVAFCVYEWKIEELPKEQSYGPLSGQIVSSVKDGCRRAFQAQPQRLMAAMYTCDIAVNQKVLGKLYAALGRRGGRVISSDLTSGAAFRVQALIPVVESFKFALELRTETSGLATPQLVFSHWEVVDIDPMWTPQTEEELIQYGEKWDSVNIAKKYMDQVRSRKGLSVDKQIVQHAEKQRTLSKNK